MLQTQSFSVQPAPGPAGSRATEALNPQKSVGVFTLLTANQQLKNDGVVTSDRYDSDGALVRDFLEAKTGEIIGSASPYNGAGLQPLSDGLTFVRYDGGATSGPAPGVTNAEFIAAYLYDRTATDWWAAYKQNGGRPFDGGGGFNKTSQLHAYGMLNAISSALGNRYVDWGMFNLNSIAMIGGLLPTDNWSASAMRYALAAPEESAGVGYRFSGRGGYESPGPSGLNRYGGLLYNPFAAEALPAGPSGNHYSVAYHMELAPASYPGLSRAAHIQEANGSLLTDMESDPEFARRMMEGLGISIERTPNGLAPRTSPEGWTWHHDQDPGAMQLVPRDQHAPGSIFQNALHPNGKGGYSIWGR